MAGERVGERAWVERRGRGHPQRPCGGEGEMKHDVGEKSKRKRG
jgi:hypothetical protein